ncbi:MAG: DUF3291 domain-containing protein [Acidobacteriota bacterium]|nr:DUF3291 domain-containing protein [Acidobacteriota bacterium]
MPPLPWTTCSYQPTDESSLHVLASTLPLSRYSDIPRFMRWASRIRRQLTRAEGCAGYSLDAQLTRKTFSTLSAWSSPEAMNAFVRSGAHAQMLDDMAGRLGKATFVESAATPTQLPLDWKAAKQRLAEAATT